MNQEQKNTAQPSEKMKPFVVYFPSSTKGKIIFLLVFFSIALGCAPIIGLVNLNLIVLGMPLIMIWGIAIMLFTMLVLATAKKWGVH